MSRGGRHLTTVVASVALLAASHVPATRAAPPPERTRAVLAISNVLAANECTRQFCDTAWYARAVGPGFLNGRFFYFDELNLETEGHQRKWSLETTQGVVKGTVESVERTALGDRAHLNVTSATGSYRGIRGRGLLDAAPPRWWLKLYMSLRHRGQTLILTPWTMRLRLPLLPEP